MTSDLSHRRTHNLLLLSKLLNLRDNASPFTLVLDSLEQPAGVLLKEYIRRTNTLKNPIVFVSFETLRRPAGVDSFITARKKSPSQISQEVSQSIQSYAKSNDSLKTHCLIIIDSLQPLSVRPDIYLPMYLSSFLVPSTTTQVSLVAVYHNDVPLATSNIPLTGYGPNSLTLLSYLATTIITLHSFSQLLVKKAAADRSVEPPPLGLEEGKESVLVGLSKNEKVPSNVLSSVAVEMEYRRKSGRSVGEWYFLRADTGSIAPLPAKSAHANKENFTLLDDHPLWRVKSVDLETPDNGEPQSTFSLSLTDRQRHDREGVVLPYFDAQNVEGGGEGGRILYDMGVEDDFDEEEDEI